MARKRFKEILPTDPCLANTKRQDLAFEPTNFMMRFFRCGDNGVVFFGNEFKKLKSNAQGSEFFRRCR